MHEAYTTISLNLKIEKNWNYYELMTKIKYKSRKAGIELIVD
ncbi:hypothetical protein [Salegentibacter sp. 24]|nr:hypothetical protein [Salegentibacter sp. 24]